MLNLRPHRSSLPLLSALVSSPLFAPLLPIPEALGLGRFASLSRFASNHSLTRPLGVLMPAEWQGRYARTPIAFFSLILPACTPRAAAPSPLFRSPLRSNPLQQHRQRHIFRIVSAVLLALLSFFASFFSLLLCTSARHPPAARLLFSSSLHHSFSRPSCLAEHVLQYKQANRIAFARVQGAS